MILANSSKLLEVLNLCVKWRAASNIGPHLLGVMLRQGKCTTRELVLFKEESTCYSLTVQTLQRLAVGGIVSSKRESGDVMTTWEIKGDKSIELSDMDVVRLTNLSLISELYDLRHVRYILVALLFSMTTKPVSQSAVASLSLKNGGPALPNQFFRRLFVRKGPLEDPRPAVIRPIKKGEYILTDYGKEISKLIKEYVLKSEPTPLKGPSS